MRPIHTHDCDMCAFVANVMFGGNMCDVWVHDDCGLFDCVIFRYSSAGPDYTSASINTKTLLPDAICFINGAAQYSDLLVLAQHFHALYASTRVAAATVDGQTASNPK